MTFTPKVATDSQRHIQIDAYVDLICPWCCIGVKRLLTALRHRQDIHAEITWHPYFLNREMPDQEPEFRAYMERKIGGALRLERLYHTLREIGKSAEIDFDFAAIPCLPNTLKAHKIIRLAQRTGQHTEVLSAFFEAYFCRGIHIGHDDVLMELARPFGLNDQDMMAVMADEALSRQIITDVETTHMTGTTGIPLFVFQHRFQITGAHDPKVLARLLDVSASFVDFEFSLSGPLLHQQQCPLTTA